MFRFISFTLVAFFCSVTLMAQPPVSKEQQELEKQRQDLKREIEQTQQLLDKNKKVTRENLGQLSLINRKMDLQGNVIDNMTRDINLLNNNIYRSQRDVNKLQLLLDTLKQEYAKSMVYSYKNRGNADFLNFIFSASSFNDAIKRVAYLKSYRAYREMQGQNILRTQELLRNRISELNGNKEKKNTALELQNKEMQILKQQQEEKNQVVSKLKAQSKELNKQIAAKKKQMQKVSNAIAAAIKRALEEARKEAAALAAKSAEKTKAEAATATTGAAPKSTSKVSKTATSPVKKESELLATAADVKLNASFEGNRGSLPWPVDRGYIMMHQGSQKLDIGVTVDNPGLTIGSDIGSSVKAIFDGEVSSVTNIDNMQVVILKHGRYFTTYSNLTGVNVSRGQSIRTGQVIGRVAANEEGLGSIDLIMSNERSNLNPESWLKHR